MIITENYGTEDIQLSEHAENVLYAVAEAHGLLVSQDEAEALGKLIELEEGALTEERNIVRLNRQAKLDALTVHSALTIAQQKQDPLFKKYAKAAEIKRKYRAAILGKYKSTAMTTARKLLANAGKKNMVEPKQAAALHPEEKK